MDWRNIMFGNYIMVLYGYELFVVSWKGILIFYDLFEYVIDE